MLKDLLIEIKPELSEVRINEIIKDMKRHCDLVSLHNSTYTFRSMRKENQIENLEDMLHQSGEFD